MKARKIIIGLSALVLLAAGCQKEAFEENTASQGKTYTAIMEQPVDQTKSTVTDEGIFAWETGDKIKIIAKDKSTDQFKAVQTSLTVSDGIGCFTLDSGYENPAYSIYPYIFNGAYDNATGRPTRIYLEDEYSSYTHSTNAVMYAKFAAGSEDDTDELVFKHLAGVLKVSFNKVPAGVDKFVITSDQFIVGYFNVDLTAETPQINISDAVGGTSNSKKVIFTFAETTGESSELTFYIPLPVGTYTGFTVQLFEDEIAVFEKSTTQTSYTINRKDLAILPVLDFTTKSDPINLSSNGTANSYIVTKAGDYYFKPTQGNTTESVGTVKTVEVLWESYGSGITPGIGDLVNNISYKDGVISFTATDKKGNAVIAAKDESGILWSWHIWLTDKPADQVYKNSAGIMMDRNLGATSVTPKDVKALGLLYQWGRKDPFLNASRFDAAWSPSSTIEWPDAVACDETTGTIEYATQHPTTFIKGNSSGGDWLSGSYIDNNRWKSTKTKYDPCPAGYRVPNGGNSGVWYRAINKASEEGSFDSTNKGMDLKSVLTGGTESCWYPAAGYRSYNDGSLSNTGIYCVVWSCTPAPGSGDTPKRANCFTFHDNHTLSYGNNSYNQRAYGASVRCQKIATP